MFELYEEIYASFEDLMESEEYEELDDQAKIDFVTIRACKLFEVIRKCILEVEKERSSG